MNGVARQRGFNVVEVAGFAVPRFISLEAEARAASRDALAGSVRSAAALAHALWLAGGRPSSVTMDGRVVAIVNGYPSAASIDDALPNHAGFRYTQSGATGTFTSHEVETCRVTYTEASPNGPPTIAALGAC
jgi:MSHA pilin protein MshA